MQKFTDVIMEFVNKMGYLSSKDIEGIIFTVAIKLDLAISFLILICILYLIIT